jgi:two-component system, NarL family, response regulator DegU
VQSRSRRGKRRHRRLEFQNQGGIAVHNLLTQILIVDHHAAASTTIRSLLDWHSFQVCGEAKDGRDAIEKVKKLKPDLVLLDINMPRMDGVKAAYEILQIAPATMIVFLAVHDAPSVMQITERWSHGYVTKAAAGTELIPMLMCLIPREAPPKRSRRTATH